ncbi:MAG: protein-tyrosine phosphatase family protein [Thermodesulfobacteriota bacterium]
MTGTAHQWKIPFDRSYWVEPGRLMAGCFPGSPSPGEAHQKLKKLLACGIREVVNLMEPHERDHHGKLFESYEGPLRSLADEMGLDVTVARFPIKDGDIPTRLEMCRILDHIDAAIQNGRPVYLHCWGGRGRTGTVVGCYLARHGLAADHQVLKMIKVLRQDVRDAHSASPENSWQIDMVLSWVERE